MKDKWVKLLFMLKLQSVEVQQYKVRCPWITVLDLASRLPHSVSHRPASALNKHTQRSLLAFSIPARQQDDIWN
jgi:hypothetical protein